MKKTRMQEIAEKMQKASMQTADPWESILPNISKGTVIPVISNSFRIEQIFREGSEAAGTEIEEPSIYEQLSQVWAGEIGYPVEDGYNLARVANYFIEQNDDPELSKAKYMMFLSNFLLAFSEEDNPGSHDHINLLKRQIQSLRFSALVRELDYPRFPENVEDPLRLLARFPLPVYITTSYFGFMEQALISEGKSPRTEVCFWTGRAEHRNSLDYHPSITNPLVYHLYGVEDYPTTLVLSEDDHLNFLLSIAEDNDVTNPKLPLYLRKACSESQLLFLGYKENDWDFRALFRVMQKFRVEGFSPRGVYVMSRAGKDTANTNVIQYLRSYFGRKSFDIVWNDPEQFIQNLWLEWKANMER